MDQFDLHLLLSAPSPCNSAADTYRTTFDATFDTTLNLPSAPVATHSLFQSNLRQRFQLHLLLHSQKYPLRRWSRLVSLLEVFMEEQWE